MIARAAAVTALALVFAGYSSLAGDPPRVAKMDERPITPAERDHWAYRPLARSAAPPGKADEPASNPIDCFLQAARAQQGVESLPRAGKATLARRLYFDLTGLPPTAKEMLDFLGDDSPDAYEKLVERLLASTAYGERYAQHWLDLARFAETDGFEHDLVRPNAWRYRDWVIEALNRDMPFDRFVSLQLAGDELEPDDPQAAVATGFLLCGPDMPDLNLQDERRHVVLNEITSTVGAVFLAMQLGCAQCHDHKFDPIRQADFYRLRAFFEPIDIFRDHPIPSAEQIAERRAAEERIDPADRQRIARRQELETLGRNRFREKNPDVHPSQKQILAELTDQERDEHAALVEALKSLPKLPEYPLARVVRDGAPREARFYARGDFRQPGPVVQCGLPAVLCDPDKPTPVAAKADRLSLARWLTHSDNPLTARVLANRLWQWHFGVGLVESASDFGLMGSAPNHPELLDWLARRLVDNGWGLKSMHRLLVTSQAYQAASAPADGQWRTDQTNVASAIWQRSKAIDPENKLLWHRRRLRLDGESIRDAMLVAADRLSTRRGGPGVRPPLSSEVTATLLKDQWLVTPDEEDHRRRSIYLFVRRNLRYPLFDVFDRPDTNASCPARHESTTATQSLALLNSPLSLHCAQWLAGSLARCAPASGEARIDEAYLRVFGRRASHDELRRGRQFIDSQSQRLRAEERTRNSLALAAGATDVNDPFQSAALVDFCLALFNSNEFLFVD